MSLLNVGSTDDSCNKQALETELTQLKDTVTSLKIQNDGYKVTNENLNRCYEELSKGYAGKTIGCTSLDTRGKECRSPWDSRNKEDTNRPILTEVSTLNALVSQCDAVGGYDWSFQTEEEPTNYALMAYASSGSSSSLGSDNKTSSKNLSKLLESQVSDKTGLGFDSQVFNSQVFNCEESHSHESDNSVPKNPENDSYKTVDNVFNVESSTNKPSKDMSKTLRPVASIIKNQISDSEDETEIKVPKTLKKSMEDMLHFEGILKVTKCVVLSSDYKMPDENHVLLRVLVTKPHNKTPYKLLLGRSPSKHFMRPFGCPVTILNTLDLLGKFDRKVDEEFLVGYSVNRKAFRVFKSRTRIVQEILHINFLENKPNVAGIGPKWLFDIDTLTQSMNYQPVVVGNQPNDNAGIKENLDAGKVIKKTVSAQQYVLLPLWSTGLQDPQNTYNDVVDASFYVKEKENDVHGLRAEFEEFSFNSTNRLNAISAPVNAAEPNPTNNTNIFNTTSPYVNTFTPNFRIARKSSFVDPSKYPDDPNMPELEDIVYSDDEEVVDVKSTSTPIETETPLLKDPDGEDVGVHIYSKELASPKQMALGKDILNLFMAGSLPNTIWHFITTVSYKLMLFGLTKDTAVNLMLLGRCIQIGGKIVAIDADEDITLVDVETQEEGVNVAEPTVFDDEEVTMTMARTLIKLKAEKAKLLDEQIAQKL
uniref:Retrovirus-related Pol polyprotein from transposon TNT 1-94 n=1 Tax=Tanacetum cinerariifolium TaxID=118510 RepID=A0A6L2J685_TANCI|nr:retrovirus-related Pol polyprotein from transposon TNT 1-94 [Tanacetum cinerariifolium]